MAAVGAAGRWAREPGGEPGGERAGVAPRGMEPSPPGSRGLAPQVVVGAPSSPPHMSNCIWKGRQRPKHFKGITEDRGMNHHGKQTETQHGLPEGTFSRTEQLSA